MKIYQTIQEAKNSKITSFPGIYYFRNKINNKYYIGQALNIRKRFCSHYIQIKKENNKYPIYKAIIKYGLENFEYGIVGIFRTWESQELLKKKLDFLEKKYIKEYNSYGNTGYNQTLGGDGGVLGYKMTEEQKKKISECSKQRANDGRYNVYIYDVIEEKEYLFKSLVEASKQLNISVSSLKNSKNNLTEAYLGKYIFGKTMEEILMIKRNLEKNSKTHTNGKFEAKYTLNEYLEIRNNNPGINAEELAKILKVCKKTVYSYEKQLPEKSRIFNVNKKLNIWKVHNTETNEYYYFDIYEGAKFFATNPKNFGKTAKRCDTDKHLYKKIFEISKYNGSNI